VVDTEWAEKPRCAWRSLSFCTHATITDGSHWILCLRRSTGSINRPSLLFTPGRTPQWEAPQTTRLLIQGSASVVEWLWAFAFVILALVILWGFRHRK
jgi:hypothetical protein